MNNDFLVFGDDVSAEYPNVMVTIERITPDVADEMLKHNTHNRHLSGNVTKNKRGNIYKSMEQGLWDLNGESIKFDCNGVLLDGQHRLMACSKTGNPFDTIVVRGLKPITQNTMDSGRKRSVADVLKLDGIKNAQSVAGASAIVLEFNKNGYQALQSQGGLVHFSRSEHISFEEQHNEQFQHAVNATDALRPLYPQTKLAALFYLFCLVSSDDAEFFIKDLKSNVPKRQPIAALRDRLLLSKSNKNHELKTSQKNAYTIKAWNAFMLGEEIKIFRWQRGGARPESFPEIYGMTDELRASIQGGGR